MRKTERQRLLKKRQSIWRSKSGGKRRLLPGEKRRLLSGGGRKLLPGGTRAALRSRYAWVGFLLPSLMGVLLFVLLPFLDVIRRSFLTAVTEEWSGLRNYEVVFANQAFRLAVKNTVRFTLVCLPLLIGIGLFFSLGAFRYFRFRSPDIGILMADSRCLGGNLSLGFGLLLLNRGIGIGCRSVTDYRGIAGCKRIGKQLCLAGKQLFHFRRSLVAAVDPEQQQSLYLVGQVQQAGHIIVHHSDFQL